MIRMTIKFFNTMTRKKEEFKPIKKGHVKVYCCGPTVYWYQHIGNLRTYIFEDVLKRVLSYNDYVTEHIINVTAIASCSKCWRLILDILSRI